MFPKAQRAKRRTFALFLLTKNHAKRKSMIIFHTSDWHRGHVLYGHKRYEEFEAFLTLLAGLLTVHLHTSSGF